MLLISVQPGQEVLATINAALAERGVQSGAVASLIGAVDSCGISNMAADDAAKDILTEYAQPFELSGTGEIKDGKVHLHVVLGREGDVALSGHLHWARVETFFVNAYVIPL
ncbi:PPC domain-containing DNA-binding protein [Catellatospora methionotrophica]|uniref:PPC domain-containing DNA-binding protein n=1 Tax=Catellatospora methionotrophica TaxID=121620 RepID=UPI0033DCEEDF